MTRYGYAELHDKASKMQSFLELSLPKDGNDLIDHLDKIDILIAQSGNMLADAKWYQDKIKNVAVLAAIEPKFEKLSATAINEFIKSECKDQNYLVNWIDRINASATHIKDSIRTIISYKKKEMEL